ncbi:hypothetical protein [Photobacterium sp. OFAV2-7]|uniref:hypothetical protein n=1 Tax=Photobacterium sp. OFAV2-7 TaxID=2917748 RepID=UPI001EF640CF|nr:hypothetical protein [Photobacterium sp. OFAV2-7]MCG7584055.1 hypothetical protein [Photobacterium sp. OFAV2-7]
MDELLEERKVALTVKEDSRYESILPQKATASLQYTTGTKKLETELQLQEFSTQR